MGIARNFQQVRLFGGLSIIENVMIGCHAHMGGRSREALWPCHSLRPEPRHAARLEMLELVGLAAPRGSPPRSHTRRSTALGDGASAGE